MRDSRGAEPGFSEAFRVFNGAEENTLDVHVVPVPGLIACEDFDGLHAGCPPPYERYKPWAHGLALAGWPHSKTGTRQFTEFPFQLWNLAPQDGLEPPT